MDDIDQNRVTSTRWENAKPLLLCAGRTAVLVAHKSLGNDRPSLQCVKGDRDNHSISLARRVERLKLVSDTTGKGFLGLLGSVYPDQPLLWTRGCYPGE